MTGQMVDCLSVLDSSHAQAFKNLGIRRVGRYLNNMSTGEVKAILDAGLLLFSIYETLPTKRTYFSYAKGQQDAKAAVALAQKLGQPTGSSITLPVDYDAQPRDFPVLAEYYKGARTEIGGYLLGGYGSYQVVEYLASQNLCGVLTQTVAWSFGRVSARADIYQRVCNTTLTGIGVDLDDVRRDIGFWPVGNADVVPPAPQNHNRAPTQGGSTLPVTQGKVKINGQDVDTLVENNTNYVPWTVLEQIPGFQKQFVNGEWEITFPVVDGAKVKDLLTQAENMLGE